MTEFSMTPLDKGESVSGYVARSLDIVDKSGLPYRLGPMGTTIEGSWDEVFAVMKQCFEANKEECKRISISIKIDYREGEEGRMASKISAVEKRVGRPLNT